jgi:hypothetical protein
MSNIASVRRGSFPGFIELRGWGAYPAAPLKAAQNRTCNLHIKGADLSPASGTGAVVKGALPAPIEGQPGRTRPQLRLSVEVGNEALKSQSQFRPGAASPP